MRGKTLCSLLADVPLHSLYIINSMHTPPLIPSSTDDAHVIFRDAAINNMTEGGHAWIVTEQALHANNTPVGVLGLVLEHANSDKEHIRVSMNAHN